MNYLLELLYAVGASLTAVFLSFVYGPKLLRYFFRHLPKTVLEWLILPVTATVILFVATLGMGFATLLWPLTAGIILREYLHKRERALEAQTEEYEGLLDQIREDRRSRPHRGFFPPHVSLYTGARVSGS